MIPAVETIVVAEELANLLSTIEGLRTYWHISDTVRPPAAVVGQPDVDFTDPAAGFCTATWTFPITLIVARGSDREAQTLMSHLLHEVSRALATEVPGIFMIEPVDASPVSVTLSGQDLPGYSVRVRVRA